MFSSTIIDPLDVGMKDCENKIIKAVSTPSICFDDDPRRAYRAISIASKIGGNIDGKIMDYVKNNYQNFMPSNNASISETYITSTIDKAIGLNDDILLQYLIDSNLLSSVPLIGKFKELLISKNMISVYLDSVK